MTKHLDRRHFISSTGLATAGAIGLATGDAARAQVAPEVGSTAIAPGSTILFQGDSITDAGRKRGVRGANNHAALGNGYAFLTAAQLLVDHPQAGYEIYNRGISGNKVFQLADRWQQDCLDINPNVLSILIGVNDIWHHLNGEYDGTVETYRSDYHKLLTETKDVLPNVRLVICEPFVLRTGAVTDKWFPAFDQFRASAKAVAEEFDAVWVPFQSMFDRAVEVAKPGYWARDGVHPSPAGAAMMAQAWLRAVGQ